MLGNEGLALLLTAITNVLGIFTMPLWLKALFSGAASAGFDLHVDIPNLLIKLLISVLVPMVVGKVCVCVWCGGGGAGARLSTGQLQRSAHSPALTPAPCALNHPTNPSSHHRRQLPGQHRLACGRQQLVAADHLEAAWGKGGGQPRATHGTARWCPPCAG